MFSAEPPATPQGDATPEYVPLDQPFTIYYADIDQEDGTLLWTEYTAKERHLDEAYICQAPTALHCIRILYERIEETRSGFALTQFAALEGLHLAVSAERVNTQTEIDKVQHQIKQFQNQLEQLITRAKVLDTGGINVGNAMAALKTPPNSF